MAAFQVYRGLLQSNAYLGLIYRIISILFRTLVDVLVHTSSGAENNSYDTFKGHVGKYK